MRARSCRRFLFLQVVGVLVGIVALSSCNNPVGSSSSDGSGSFMRVLPNRFMLDLPQSLREQGPARLGSMYANNGNEMEEIFSDFQAGIREIEDEAIWTGFWFMVADQILSDDVTLGTDKQNDNYSFDYNQAFVNRLETYFRSTPMWDRTPDEDDEEDHFFERYQKILGIGMIPVSYEYKTIADDSPYNHYIRFAILAEELPEVNQQEMIIVWSDDRQHVAHVNAQNEDADQDIMYFFAFDGVKNESYFLRLYYGIPNRFHEVILRRNTALPENGMYFRGRSHSSFTDSNSLSDVEDELVTVLGLANDRGGSLSKDSDTYHFDSRGDSAPEDPIYSFISSDFDGMDAVKALQDSGIGLRDVYKDFFWPQD